MTLVLSIVFDWQEDSRKKTFWYALACLYLILLAGFRYNLGGDTQSYMIDFEDVPSSTQYYHRYVYENIIFKGHMPGWTLLTLLCKSWFDSFYALQLIQSALVNVCIFYIFHKYTKHIFLCALIYGLSGQFFNLNTEVMREAIAVACCGIAMYQYLRGNKVLFYLLVIASITFHISAVIVLLFPFVRIKRISIPTLIIAFFSSFSLWLISDIIVSYLPNFLSDQISISQKILSYSDKKSTIYGFLLPAIRYLIAQAGILYCAKNYLSNEYNWETDYSSYMSFYIILAVLACGLPGFTRFTNYTIIFSLMMVTEFISNMKFQFKSFPIFRTTIICIFFYFCFRFYFNRYSNIDRYSYEFFVPYTCILNEDVNVDYRYYMWYEAISGEKTSKNSRSY